MPNFEYETASSESDYLYFHTHMLTPFVKNRHGDTAFVAPFEELFASAHHSILVFLKHNGQRIAVFHLIWNQMITPILIRSEWLKRFFPI